ncbi:hypothetical protein AB0K09_25755 [Streptomyces sp. NPDC049577]|uniref:hypothetical protein n=1 Tax=Streptomyces sp. NPDC049577 TaxID=3155153 RepID=UPI0034427C13
MVPFTPTHTAPAEGLEFWRTPKLNETLGPMDASLFQDGRVQGSGTTTDTDTNPGGSTRTGPYTLSGQIKDGTTGSPSYTMTLTLDAQYNLTGAR